MPESAPQDNANAFVKGLLSLKPYEVFAIGSRYQTQVQY